MKNNKLTPMMRQYMDIKNKHEDAILFFRLGDFYEVFFDDALIASRELEIALTQREMGGKDKAPMAGVPHHSSQRYIEELVDKGYKVAICEQLEDAADAKGIVKRDVVQVITPGTIIKEQNRDENNYLLCADINKNSFAISVIDIGTGELSVTSFKDNYNIYPLLLDEVAKWDPKEFLISDYLYHNSKFVFDIKEKYSAMINIFDAYSFSEEENINYINEKIPNIDDKLFDSNLALKTTASLLRYIYKYEKKKLQHIQNIHWYNIDKWMKLDHNTRFHLDLQKNQRTGDTKNTLFSVLNHTKTAMGTRRLHQFLERPLLSISNIKYRQNIVEILYNNAEIRLKVGEMLQGVYDLDRLIGRISYQRANGPELLRLKTSLKSIKELKEYLETLEFKEIKELAYNIDPMEDIYQEIKLSINEDSPLSITDGGIIKIGYNEELDNIRNTSIKGQEELIDYEIRIKKETGINNLKIVYNKLRGYFLDVTKSHLDKVPKDWTRKQTLTNSERYVSEDLLRLESMILTSSEETKALEYEIFQEIRIFILNEVQRMQDTSNLLSKLDVYYSFSVAAINNGYIRPEFRDDGLITIEEGRHPVVEKNIENNEFVHNDTNIGENNNRLQIITGPNMSGKSTYMRQIALIVLMAQMGSFVPAKFASITPVNQLFTRIGASDNLSAGDSTFMTEMKEMSYILAHANENSLLILDEIGRGTSTFDGMSIAWAIIEYIVKNINAKTLFATHYHELTDLAKHFNSINNMTIAVKEDNGDIIFLRKLLKGHSNRSYGIEVAKMANFPSEIIHRAQLVLNSLEENKKDVNIEEIKENQIDLSQLEKDRWIKNISDININNITPLEALHLLNKLKNEAEGLK